MLVDKLAHFVDGADAVQIALALSLAPGEQAMAAQQNAFRTRVLPDGIFEHESQFEAGTLPRQPNDLTVELAVELVEFPLSVGTCGQRNSPVGMKVVNVVIGDERMEGCVNGCRYAILAEGRQRVVTHHFVLMPFARIKLFQFVQTIQVEQRESRLLDGADVSATSLDRQYTNWLASERVR